MTYMVNHPRVLCLACLFGMWLLAFGGTLLHRRVRSAGGDRKEDLSLVVSATLTLLGLLIGFTFSMATTRYDQRRLYEESEANAIGTEYVRAQLMPAADSEQVRGLLRTYLRARIDFYTSDYGMHLQQLDNESAVLQGQMWAAVRPLAQQQPNPVTALVVSGMNDVLNSSGYTQFSYWNRIPVAAWTLMIVVGLLANGLVGYVTNPATRSGRLLLLVLPVIVSLAFFLISDIDSPRGGVIRVPARDLVSLAHQLQ